MPFIQERWDELERALVGLSTYLNTTEANKLLDRFEVASRIALDQYERIQSNGSIRERMIGFLHGKQEKVKVNDFTKFTPLPSPQTPGK